MFRRLKEVYKRANQGRTYQPPAPQYNTVGEERQRGRVGAVGGFRWPTEEEESVPTGRYLLIFILS